MISVCMATYNGEKYIKQQIDSILCQLSVDDELIISDDDSTDRTIEIINTYNDSRIKVYHNDGIHGCAYNFENALNQAKGDYIFLSDQDDVWLPHKVDTILPFLKGDNLIVTDVYITNENLEIQKRLSQFRKYKRGYIHNLYKSIYMGCTNAMTKKVRDYCLPFPRKCLIQHDNWIGLICELKFKVIYIKEPLILYRRHQSNLSGVSSKTTYSIFYQIKYRFILFIFSIIHIIMKTINSLRLNSICINF
jgi:glycosyltransferase involved in cell wall biosynthesis